ncbi:hypothetical protein CTAYLR_001173 [Chrysophaeum taylorii]|uniref:Tyrosine-protein kinase ephrin type A/B receptor-like domain-containing protein n=1 Tax=Chrysophaeum taylorii TaxID=2483200 RepID=A0AAD7UPT3_9STRA|nr:hypothetical protein CTAYLR_001173 [Chrysophaeum taylorii]
MFSWDHLGVGRDGVYGLFRWNVFFIAGRHLLLARRCWVLRLKLGFLGANSLRRWKLFGIGCKYLLTCRHVLHCRVVHVYELSRGPDESHGRVKHVFVLLRRPVQGCFGANAMPSRLVFRLWQLVLRGMRCRNFRVEKLFGLGGNIVHVVLSRDVCAGYYALGEGSTAQTACAAGTISAGSAGRYSGTGQTYCSKCATGTWSDEGDSACVSSSAGTISPSGTTLTVSIESELVAVVNLTQFAGDTAAQSGFETALTSTLSDFSDYVTLPLVVTVLKSERRRLDESLAANESVISFLVETNYSAASNENTSTVLELLTLEFIDDLVADLQSGAVQEALDAEAGNDTVLASAMVVVGASADVVEQTTIADVIMEYGSDDEDGVQECPPGYYSLSGASSCACVVGTFNPYWGQTSCIRSAAGFFANVTALTRSFQCPPGSYSAGEGASECTECALGAYAASSGHTSCVLASSGYVVPTPGATSQTACLTGYIAAGSGGVNCTPCTAGEYAASSGLSSCTLADAGYYVGTKAASSQVACPPGYISGAAASACSPCSAGSFQASSGQASCALASAGMYVGATGASNQTECPAGSYSGSGASECELCSPPFYNPDVGQTECTAAAAGTVVSDYGATAETECPRGSWSSAASTSCTLCELGEYNNKTRQSDCSVCSSPLYTTKTGSYYCDACRKGYYWDTIHWELYGKDALESNDEQCTDCCVDCDDDDGLDCDTDGVVLEGLEVKSGYWRATALSTKTYECSLSHACEGGNDTRTSVQCSHGNKGALCGACKRNYDFDPVANKCLKCKTLAKQFEGAGVLVCVFLLSVVIGIWSLKKFLTKERWAHFKKMAVLVGTGKFNMRDADKFGEMSSSRRKQAEEEAEERQKRLQKSIMTKVKIIVAAYQIATSTQFVIPQVNFPDIFKTVLRASNIIGLDFMSLGSTDCLIHLSYFHKLMVTTLSPFVFTFLVVMFVIARLRIKYGLGHYPDIKTINKKAGHALMYFFLLLIYVALPTCSTNTFRYFSCVRYDRGHGRGDLHALQSDPSIQCTTARYKGWLWYVLLMIAIWPIGFPLGLTILLYCYKERLNPRLDAEEERAIMAHLARVSHPAAQRALPPPEDSATKEEDDEDRDDVDDDDDDDDDEEKSSEDSLSTPKPRETCTLEDPENAFMHCRNKYAAALREIRKLEIRDEDHDLEKIAFVYEEYEPRCWWFPVYEALRRVFMTGVLTMFFPGSLSQVAMGLVFALVSHRVFSEYEPYIEDDDDLISEVAQTQLIIVYFAGMVIYTSTVAEKKEALFQSNVFGIFLILVFTASFSLAAYIVIVDSFGKETFNYLGETAKSKMLSTRENLNRHMSTVYHSTAGLMRRSSDMGQNRRGDDRVDIKDDASDADSAPLVDIHIGDLTTQPTAVDDADVEDTSSVEIDKAERGRREESSGSTNSVASNSIYLVSSSAASDCRHDDDQTWAVAVDDDLV